MQVCGDPVLSKYQRHFSNSVCSLCGYVKHLIKHVHYYYFICNGTAHLVDYSKM